MARSLYLLLNHFLWQSIFIFIFVVCRMMVSQISKYPLYAAFSITVDNFTVVEIFFILFFIMMLSTLGSKLNILKSTLISPLSFFFIPSCAGKSFTALYGLLVCINYPHLTTNFQKSLQFISLNLIQQCMKIYKWSYIFLLTGHFQGEPHELCCPCHFSKGLIEPSEIFMTWLTGI